MQTTSGMPNGSGDVLLDGTPVSAAPIGPLSWTQYRPNGSPFNRPPNMNFVDPLTTFCIELGSTPATQISPDKAYAFGVRGPAGAPTIGTPEKADAILELYGRHYNPAWEVAGFAGSAASVAFQLALWELVYDGPAPPAGGVTDPNTRFAVNPAVFPEAATAQGWVTGLSDGVRGTFATRFPNAELVALVAPAAATESKTESYTQDQLAIRPTAVPAPPAAFLAGLGVVALVGRSRLRRGR